MPDSLAISMTQLCLTPCKTNTSRLLHKSRTQKKYGVVTDSTAFAPYEKQYLSLGELEWGSSEFQQTLLGQAVGLCLKELAVGLANLIQTPPDLTFTGTEVLEIVDLRAYINVGSAGGVQTGHRFGVWETVPGLVDPETGDFLGRALMRRVGLVQVEQVLGENLSLVRILEGSELIQKGFQIRPE